MSGQTGNVNIPKMVIEAQRVIYNGSALMSVVNASGIKTENTDVMDILEERVRGESGKDDVSVDSLSEPARLSYKEIQTSITVTEYNYAILNSARLNSRDPRAMMNANIISAAEYFARIRDYRGLSAIKAAAMNSASATAEWDADGADPSKDIIDGYNTIMAKSNAQLTDKISCIVPAEVFGELRNQTRIENIQTSWLKWLQKTYPLTILPYRPATNSSGTALNDGLGNDALMYVAGRKTATMKLFNTKKDPKTFLEAYRMPGRGDGYIQRMGTACLVDYDGTATWTSKTNYLNNNIYKITGVKS